MNMANIQVSNGTSWSKGHAWLWIERLFYRWRTIQVKIENETIAMEKLMRKHSLQNCFIVVTVNRVHLMKINARAIFAVCFIENSADGLVYA